MPDHRSPGRAAARSTRAAGASRRSTLPALPASRPFHAGERVGLTDVRAVVERARPGEPTDHWHLHAVCRTLPTDVAPYGFRVRVDAADRPCGCRWFVHLAGRLGSDWGVCTNPVSPRVGLLTFEHHRRLAFTRAPGTEYPALETATGRGCGSCSTG
jgi:hypothetical protein